MQRGNVHYYRWNSPLQASVDLIVGYVDLWEWSIAMHYNRTGKGNTMHPASLAHNYAADPCIGIIYYGSGRNVTNRKDRDDDANKEDIKRKRREKRRRNEGRKGGKFYATSMCLFLWKIGLIIVWLGKKAEIIHWSLKTFFIKKKNIFSSQF